MAFYVYIYRDPLNGNVPVYVGKGMGERGRINILSCVSVICTSGVSMLHLALARSVGAGEY